MQEIQEPIQPLNTAILWDIENLLGGYNFDFVSPDKLSLRKILDEMRAARGMRGVAVQRAYANWSDSRLAILRTELNELGIEPIQVFGFGRESKMKNAADVQLIIDALELMHQRPGITTFSIISGDGGFAALVRMLHQYGRWVVCGAWKGAASSTLKAICDDFRELERPVDALREKAVVRPAAPRAAGRPAASAELAPSAEAPAILAAVTRLLERCRTRPAMAAMNGDGLDLSRLQPALTALLEPIGVDLALARCGGLRWTQLLQAATNQNVFIAQSDKGNRRLFSSQVRPPGNWKRLAPFPLEPHTPESYRAILAADRLRLPDSPESAARALNRFLLPDWLNRPCSEVIARIAEGDGTTGDTIPVVEVTRAWDLLLAAGQGFTTGGENGEAPLFAGLAAGHYAGLRRVILDAALARLEQVFGPGKANLEVLESILPAEATGDEEPTLAGAAAAS